MGCPPSLARMELNGTEARVAELSTIRCHATHETPAPTDPGRDHGDTSQAVAFPFATAFAVPTALPAALHAAVAFALALAAARKATTCISWSFDKLLAALDRVSLLLLLDVLAHCVLAADQIALLRLELL